MLRLMCCMLCLVGAVDKCASGGTRQPRILVLDGSEIYQGGSRHFTREALATIGWAFEEVTPEMLSQSNFRLSDYALFIVGPKWSLRPTKAEIRDALNVDAREIRAFVWGGGILWLNVGGRTPSPRDYWTKAWSPYDVNSGMMVDRAGVWPIVIKQPAHPIFRGFKHERPNLNLGLYFHNIGPEWEVLAGDENGASIMEAPYGKGWILANCTSSSISGGC